jgi:hypothetical protein
MHTAIQFKFKEEKEGRYEKGSLSWLFLPSRWPQVPPVWDEATACQFLCFGSLSTAGQYCGTLREICAAGAAAAL